MSISRAGTASLGDLVVPRMGYGTMRLIGAGISGPPADREAALQLLRRAVELGVRMLDTAWYYGDDVANELVASALHPYPDDLVLVTKLGAVRENGRLGAGVRPDQLRQGNERDLRVLRLESVPVTHLRWPGDHANAPFAEALGTMLELVAEGRIQRLGLSNVSHELMDETLAQSSIVSVSNAFGLTHRGDDAMVDRCAAAGIAYLPYFPLGSGTTPAGTEGLNQVAAELDASPATVALAWLLHRSPTIVPIPGTSSVAHLEENVAAADLELSAAQLERLGSAPQAAVGYRH